MEMTKYQAIGNLENQIMPSFKKHSVSKYNLEDVDDHKKMEYFSLGMSCGASAQMLLVTFFMLFLSAAHDSGPLNELSKEYYPMFRMIFFVLWFFILYGVNLFLWKRYRISYHAIMGLDEEEHSYPHVLRGATSLAYIVFTCFVVYALMVAGLIGGRENNNWKHLFPALALVLPIVAYMSPSEKAVRLCFGDTARQQRYGLFKELGYVITAPFVTCTPLRSLIGDILCSMPKVFTDLSYSVCLYSDWQDLADGSTECVQGPLASSASARYWYLTLTMSMIPYVLRLCQTLRNYFDKGCTTPNDLWNALKYFMSISVTLLNTVKVNTPIGPEKDMMTVAWFVVAASTTIFSYYWDIVMGWGLMDFKSKNFLLRDELTYPKSWYYVAIILNFLLRLVWAFNISPGQPYVAQNMILLIGCMELFRRFVWLAFRVEQLHLVARDKQRIGH